MFNFKHNAKISPKRLSIDIEPEHQHYLICYIPSHIILEIDDDVCNKLEYKTEELVGKDFRPLLLSNIMQKYLKEVYTDNFSFKKWTKIIKDITRVRYHAFITKSDNLIWMSDMHPIPSINIDKNILEDPFKMKLYFNVVVHPTYAPNIPKDFLGGLSHSPTFKVKHFNEAIIIMMDVANSSIISTTKTPVEIALMFHEIIKCTTYRVNRSYYPFIRFIEACGDSLLFWHCPELGLSLSNIHTECIYFALKITEELNIILKPYGTYMRCGMVSGECGGGVWDGKTFRVSGKNINLSSRLESRCKKDHIVISETFYNNILKENYNFKNNSEEVYEDLKGLGKHRFYHINLDSARRLRLKARESINEMIDEFSTN